MTNCVCETEDFDVFKFCLRYALSDTLENVEADEAAEVAS